MVSFIDYLASGVIDDNGNAVAAGTVYFYEAGTTTPVSVYQERELETAHANPATLDSAGKLIAFSNTRLKLSIYNSAGVAVRTIDNVGVGEGDITGDDLADGSIVAANLVDGCVTTAKLANGAVTTAKIADSAVTTAKIADGAVTQAKRAALGQQVSSSSSNYSTTSASMTSVTNLNVSITTTGRPVQVMLIHDGSSNNGYISATNTSPVFSLVRNLDTTNTQILRYDYLVSAEVKLPVSTIKHVDIPSAGTHTYHLRVQSNGSITVNVQYAKLVAFEL